MQYVWDVLFGYWVLGAGGTRSRLNSGYHGLGLL